MLTHKPAYSRPVDPLHNFGIKITMKKVRSSDDFKKQGKKLKKKKKKKNRNGKENADSEGDDDEGSALVDKDLGKTWTHEFEWQEKKFSPRELWNYRPDVKVKSRWSRIEESYHRQLERAKKNEEEYLPQPGVTISTKVDKDGFVPDEEKRNITTSCGDMTELGKSVVMFSARTGAGAVSASKNRLKRETSMSVMYIMATVDLSEVDLSAKKPKFDGKEVVLCSIKMNEKNGLIEMKPPFKYEEFGSGGAIVSDTLGERKKDMRGRGTYQFRTKSGAVYEYTLENSAALSDELVAEEVLEADRKSDLVKIEQLNNRSGTRYSRTVYEESNVAVSTFCEIVSATQFEGEYLYVQWKVVLPPVGWRWAPELTAEQVSQLSSGSTQICKSSYNSTGKVGAMALIHPTANFSFPLDIHLVSSVHNDASRVHNWPQIFFEVGSAGSWGRHYVEGYGYMKLPNRPGTYNECVSTWKPHGSIRQQMEDFFLGGSRHLSDHSSYVALPRPSERGPFLNKYGFSTETSGKIRVRFNVVMHHAERYPPTSATTSGKTVVDPVQKSRGVNDILDSLQMNRTTNLKQVMGRVESEGSNDRLSILYSKLRTSGTSARRRGGSPVRRGQSTGDVPATPKTSSRLLARLKANSSMKKAATEGDV